MYNLTVVHFNPGKREFSLLLNIPGQGRGEEGKEEVKKATFPTLLTMIVVCLLGFWLRNTSLVEVGNPILNGTVFVFHLA